VLVASKILFLRPFLEDRGAVVIFCGEMVTLVKSEAFRGCGGVSTARLGVFKGDIGLFVGGLLDELDENVGRVVGGEREARDESEEEW